MFLVRSTLATALVVSTCCFAAEKPLPRHYYKPLVIEPAKTAAGDSVSNRCTDPSQPCYVNNKDILKGRRTLLGIHDIVFTAIYNGDGGQEFSGNGYVQQTKSSAFGNRIFAYSGPSENPPYSFDQTYSSRIVSARLIRNAAPFAVDAQYALSGVRLLHAVIDSPVDTYGGIDALTSFGGRVANDVGRLFAASADFAADGREEVAFAAFNSVCLLSANDPTNLQNGLSFPACTTLPANSDGSVRRAYGVAAAVFGANTSPRIAVLSSTPGSTALTTGAYLTLYNVDPKTFALTVASDTTLIASGTSFYGLSLAAGRFNASANQLAVFASDQTFKTEIQPVDFTPSGSLILPKPSSIPEIPLVVIATSVAGAFGIPQIPNDQVLLVYSQLGIPANLVATLAFDSTFSVTRSGFTSQVGCYLDLAVGNFDHTAPDPNNPGATIRDGRDQVMLMTAEYSNNSCTVDAQLTIFNPSFANDGTLNPPANGGNVTIPGGSPGFRTNVISAASIGAVDTQGRSLLLGDPTIITFLERQKISQIVAMPPMHVDAVPGGNGSGPFQLYNFTVAPSGYKASFDLGTQQSNTTSNKYTSTWSFSSEESVGAKFNVGICGDDGEDGDCVKTESKFSAKQALDGSTSTDNSQSSSLQYQLDGETSDSDLVLYSGSALTDYIYPVLGKTVCPKGAASCDPSARVPETVQFAGTDSVVKEGGAGIDLPWYQPVWMFGNVLSYPTNECQLEIDSFGACGASADSSGTLEELSGQLTLSADFRGVQTNTWINNKSSGSTTAFNQNYSFDLNTSVTYEDNELVVSGEASASLDLSGSFGFQSLVDSRTETQASNGIQFTKTSFFQSQPSSLTWGYDITSRIFGQKQPVTAPDAKVPNNADSPAVPDITSFGTLRTAFVVQPNGALFNALEGGWYGSGTDIGLNQPRHWYYTPGQRASSTCLLSSAGNSQADCVALSQPGGNPFTDAFHVMRGFFIIPAAASGTQPLATGPQVERLKYDGNYILRVRVYNFSTVDTAAGQTIHARFYAMPVSGGAANTAGSTLLGEATASSISHWGSDTNLVNWTYIDFPFTPGSGRINQDLSFWVVVWVQNADGSLVKDLGGHGLTAIPPASLQWSDIGTFEETYSNNIGFYNSVVYVVGENAASAAASSSSPTSLEIVSGSAERTVVRLGASTALTVLAQVGAAPISKGLNFKFYEGDPRFGGKLVGLRRFPYFRADELYELAINYRPKTLGPHEIFVTAGEGSRFQHSVKLRTITVLPQ